MRDSSELSTLMSTSISAVNCKHPILRIGLGGATEKATSPTSAAISITGRGCVTLLWR